MPRDEDRTVWWISLRLWVHGLPACRVTQDKEWDNPTQGLRGSLGYGVSSLESKGGIAQARERDSPGQVPRDTVPLTGPHITLAPWPATSACVLTSS